MTFPVLEYGGPAFDGAIRARSLGVCEWCGKERATLVVAKRRCNQYEPSDTLHLCQACADRHVIEAAPRRARTKKAGADVRGPVLPADPVTHHQIITIPAACGAKGE